jgi:uncharacterized membrane protein HdeD (DUF308 family)
MPSGSSIFSVVLPVIGFLILMGGIAEGREMADNGHSALIGFCAWIILSIGGGSCGIFSLARQEFNITAIIGSFLCAIPFLCIVYGLTINSR